MKKWPPILYPGPGGTHRNAVPALAQRGSWPDGDGYQQIIDEICAVVLGAGLSLDGVNSAQLAWAVRSHGMNWAGAAGGTSDALELTVGGPTIVGNAALTGMPIAFLASASNTTVNPNVRVNGNAPRPLRTHSGQRLVPGSIINGGFYVMYYDGDVARVVGVQESSIFSQDYIVYAAAGSYSFVVPSDVNLVFVTVQGAGGGGGGAAATGTGIAAAAGGSGGGYTERWLAVVPGSTIPLTVGAGGAAGASTPGAGGTGGTSSFGGLLTATGGGGGGSSVNGSAPSIGAVGVGIGGPNISGIPGAPGTILAIPGSTGNYPQGGPGGGSRLSSSGYLGSPFAGGVADGIPFGGGATGGSAAGASAGIAAALANAPGGIGSAGRVTVQY